MYAYVMRPETLPESYNKFIVQTGPINPMILEAVRNNNRGNPIDLQKLLEYCKSMTPKDRPFIPPSSISTPFPALIGCDVLHPHHETCRQMWWWTAKRAARKTLPLYITLTFVPLFVLHFFKLLKRPVQSLTRASIGTLQSTLFLTVFVTVYQAVCCLQRKTVSRDQRSIYFIAGLIAGAAILIEKKERRAELALYALPRAIDSLFMQLVDRRFMFSIPYGEIILFCISMSGLMYFHHNEPQTMSPLLNTIIKFLLTRKQVKLW